MNKTHIKELEKYNTRNGVWMGGRGETGSTMSLDAPEFLFFDSAKEASNNAKTFLNLKFIKKQKTTFFFEKILHANKLKVKKVSLNVPDLL